MSFKIRYVVLILLILLATSTSGCFSCFLTIPSPTPTPIATVTAMPTTPPPPPPPASTPTPTVEPTKAPTITPTVTATPTATPVPTVKPTATPNPTPIQLSTPALVSPANNAMFTPPKSMNFSWNAVPNVNTYRLEVYENVSGWVSRIDTQVTMTSYTQSIGFGATQWRWRVTAIGAGNYRSSTPSEWRYFSFKPPG